MNKNLVNFKFILGAKDPEMNLIEKILKSVGADFEYARDINGEIVNPTSAYEAINTTDKKAVFIECKNPNINNYVSIDHHNFGDFGYDLDHNDFVAASSVGQLIQFLALHNVELGFEVVPSLQENDKFYFCYTTNNWLFSLKNGLALVIPQEVVTVAAVDHSLSAAYQGKCLGVDSETLKEVRSESLSENLKLDKDFILSKMNVYDMIIAKTETEILDLTHLELGIGYTADYLILREIAIAKEIAVAVKTKNSSEDKNHKLMLLSLTEGQVKNFLLEKAFNGLKVTSEFGVPTRGYAGGMLVD